jgi:chaperone BCS1
MNIFWETSVCVYNLIENSFWKPVYKKKRSLKSFIYDRKTEIVEEIREFYRKKEWYLERGLLHEKGFLLYGPPGTGKSTFAAVIASELNLSIYYLSPFAQFLMLFDLI